MHFRDNPAARDNFISVTIQCEAIIKSYKQSVFSYEWLNADGAIKEPESVTEAEQQKYKIANTKIQQGETLEKPILGVGMLDNVEIGSGRALLIALVRNKIQTADVHIPIADLDFFKEFIDDSHIQKTQEKGSAIVYILLAIGLLAAVSIAVTQSLQGGTSNLNTEQRRLLAGEILESSNTLAETVARLRLNGCAENQLSFETVNLTGYENTDAPSDESCHAYSIAGGGIIYQPINTEVSATGSTASWQIVGNLEVQHIGTNCGTQDCTDLLLLASNISEDVCEQLNELSIISTNNIAGQNLTTPVNFQGDYAYDDTIGDISATERLAGKKSGCFRRDNDGSLHFYRVLFAR